MATHTRGVLVVTCDEPPVPPLNGNNRKIHDVLRALAPEYALEVVAYPTSPEQRAALLAYWQGSEITWHFLARRTRGRHARALRQQLSLPTVTRDFVAEAAVVQQAVRRGVPCRVLVDLISGSPLCTRVPEGVLVSGHDCMSHFWKCMAAWAGSARERWVARVRRHFALQAERRFYHRAARVHVVSSLDARELARINPAARTVVIPLGGKSADPRLLQPEAVRSGGWIWGNLAFGPIASGARSLLAAMAETPTAWSGWTLVGALPEAEARRRLPELAMLNLAYAARVPHLEAGLGALRTVVLPDLSGAGQKNRCLDALSHGCCVVGLAEVFRDFPGEAGRHYLEAKSPADLATLLRNLSPTRAAELGREGQALFESHFTMTALADRWRAALDAVPPLRAGLSGHA